MNASRPAHAFLLVIALCLAGCPAGQLCTAGFVLDADGRCVAAGADAAVDASADADGPPPSDGGGVDGGADACSPQPFYPDGDGDGHGAMAAPR